MKRVARRNMYYTIARLLARIQGVTDRRNAQRATDQREASDAPPRPGEDLARRHGTSREPTLAHDDRWGAALTGGEAGARPMRDLLPPST